MLGLKSRSEEWTRPPEPTACESGIRVRSLKRDDRMLVCSGYRPDRTKRLGPGSKDSKTRGDTHETLKIHAVDPNSRRLPTAAPSISCWFRLPAARGRQGRAIARRLRRASPLDRPEPPETRASMSSTALSARPNPPKPDDGRLEPGLNRIPGSKETTGRRHRENQSKRLTRESPCEQPRGRVT